MPKVYCKSVGIISNQVKADLLISCGRMGMMSPSPHFLLISNFRSTFIVYKYSGGGIMYNTRIWGKYRKVSDIFWIEALAYKHVLKRRGYFL